MANRYWVGGSGTWDATTTTNWSASSNGSAGASAPTSADDVFFDASSGAAPTVTIGTNAACGAVTATAPTSGTLTFAFGTTGVISYNGNWSNPATLFATTGTGPNTGAISYVGSGSSTFTSNGYSFTTSFGLNTSAGTLTLGGALTSTAGAGLSISQGTFSTSASNYSLSLAQIQTATANAKTISLNASTVTLSGSTPLQIATGTVTFNAGTSTINCSSSTVTFAGAGQTFNVVSLTSSALTLAITGANTFASLTIASRTADGINTISLAANQTISGTLTLGAANTAVRRVSVTSNTNGTARTLTVATIATLSDVDFQDIIAAGASGTWSGTRLGNCGGNTNITFVAGKTVYWNLAGAQSWSAVGWATSSGGSPAVNNFPLAQDTAIFDSTGSVTGTITVNAVWNIGTLDMSGRTSPSFPMTLATGSQTPNVYGSWKNGTGTTLSGTQAITFAGRLATQQITSNGIAFTQPITINNSTGTVQLQDDFTTGTTITTTLTSGTLDLNGKTLTTGLFSSSNSNTRTIAFGAGNITLTGSSLTIWNTGTDTNFVYTGTPTVNCTYSGSVGTRILGTGTAATETYAINFNVSAGSDTVTANQRYGTLNFTGFTGTLNNNTRIIYKSLILSSSMTCTPGTLITNFLATSGTWQITSNNQTLDFPVTFNGLGGTWACTDALTLGSSRALTFSLGTLQLKASATNTVGSFVTSGTTLKYLQSTTSGTQATLSQASGTVTATYLSIQDSAATGGATFTATSGTNVNAGNNSGWTFSGGVLYYTNIGPGITVGGGIVLS